MIGEASAAGVSLSISPSTSVSLCICPINEWIRKTFLKDHFDNNNYNETKTKTENLAESWKGEVRQLMPHQEGGWQEAEPLAPSLTSQLPRHDVHHHRGDLGVPVILQENTVVRPSGEQRNRPVRALGRSSSSCMVSDKKWEVLWGAWRLSSLETWPSAFYTGSKSSE